VKKREGESKGKQGRERECTVGDMLLGERKTVSVCKRERERARESKGESVGVP